MTGPPPVIALSPDMKPTHAITAVRHGLRASRGFVAMQSGMISLVLVLVFVTACLLLQWLRSDLDWRLAPMSSYLKGPYGGWLRFAYYGLGVGLVLLGHGLRRALQPDVRDPWPLRLLVLAGFALGVTAITETRLPVLDRAQALMLHQLAALVTFLSVTVAMLLQSWRFQAHAAWRPYFRLAFPLAVASFLALGIYASGHGLPHVLELPEGVLQKCVITLIVSWLGSAAWWLHCAQRVAAPVAPPPRG